jgi:hypothetical protein
MKQRIAKACLAVLFCGASALAAEAPKVGSSSPNAAARAHFEEGIALAQRGELSRAVSEFETAYAISPHFSVLYNIGQTEVARGRLVEAVTAFERYLASGGSEVPADRRRSVSDLIAQYRNSTRVWIDGKELHRERLTSAVPLSAGTHSLFVTVGVGAPIVQEVEIRGEDATKVRIAHNETPEPPDAFLLVTCGTPDVLVTIDGRDVERTPIIRPLLVLSGERRLRFSRAGYGTVERVVQLDHGRPATVDCGLQIQLPLTSNLAARIDVQPHPKQAWTRVDGVSYSGALIPIGKHELVVEHDGYLPYRTMVTLEPRTNLLVRPVLSPTPAGRARAQRRLARRRTLAYALAGSGSALLLTSGGLAWWNQDRFNSFQETQSPSQNPDPNRVISIQRVDDLSIGLAVAGTGLILGAVYAYLTRHETE